MRSLFHRRLLLSGLSLLVAFAGMEAAYRWYKWRTYGLLDYPDVLSLGYSRPDLQYGQVCTSNFSSDSLPLKIRRHPKLWRDFGAPFHTNSWGYRSKEFAARKEPDTYRIVALGGSTTLCMELGDSDTWPARLERILNEDPEFSRRSGKGRVEVINGGNGAWRTREVLLRLRQEIPRLEPDLILVDVNWNDACRGTEGEDPDRPRVPRRPWWYRVKLFQNVRIRVLRSLDFNRSYMEACRRRLSADERWARRMADNLQEMHRAASALGAGLALVDFPGLCRRESEAREVTEKTRVTPQNYLYWVEMKELVSALLRQAGEELRVPVLSVHRDFEALFGPDRLALFIDEMHVNEKGAERIAQAIGRALQDAKDV